MMLLINYLNIKYPHAFSVCIDPHIFKVFLKNFLKDLEDLVLSLIYTDLKAYDSICESRLTVFVEKVQFLNFLSCNELRRLF